jgi:serine/threonine-protein kinase
MGRVYLATDTRLGRTVALKALAPHLVRDPSQRERLRREGASAASLTHPGICTVLTRSKRSTAISTSRPSSSTGHTLGVEIRRRAPPFGRRWCCGPARELAAALASAHARGIVHSRPQARERHRARMTAG